MQRRRGGGGFTVSLSAKYGKRPEVGGDYGMQWAAKEDRFPPIGKNRTRILRIKKAWHFPNWG